MKKVKIGIAGLGVVGRGTYEILQNEAKVLQQKTGCNLEVVAVSARTTKDFIPKNVKFYADPMQLAVDPEVDILVELIGGVQLAKNLVIEGLKNHKKIVTANKALLAQDGAEIAELCEKYQGIIGFEASTAGANPVIKAFKESFIGSKLSEFYGILNGTCNFVLTKMANENQSYEMAIKQAQEMGFAEADPSLDVLGFDAAHKLTILAAIASSSAPCFAKTYIEGINQISIDDINLAGDLGYKIKLLGIYKNFGDEVLQAVYPALVSSSEKIAQIDGSYNGLLTLGSNFEWNMMIGRGAGGKTTGSAVVADIADIACGRNNSPLFSVLSKNFTKIAFKSIAERFGRYFIRLDFDKQNVANEDLSNRLFANKIKFSQASFITKSSENSPKEKLLAKKLNKNLVAAGGSKSDSQKILCGILTENHLESEIVEILANLDKSLVDSVKFIRVEETKF